MDRDKMLDVALTQIEKQYGKGSIMKMDAEAIKDIEVELVLTNPPRPAGRGSQLTPTAVSDAAGAIYGW